MYGASPDLEKSLRLAPGIDAAAWEAVRAYQPSDTLDDVLDQEMLELAETARDLPPGEQWDRLRNAAKEDLQRKIQDPGSRRLSNPPEDAVSHEKNRAEGHRENAIKKCTVL